MLRGSSCAGTSSLLAPCFSYYGFFLCSNIRVVQWSCSIPGLSGVIDAKIILFRHLSSWDSAGAGPGGWFLGGDTELRCDVHRASPSWVRKNTAGMGRGDAAFGEMLLLGPVLPQWHPKASSLVTWQGRSLETA